MVSVWLSNGRFVQGVTQSDAWSTFSEHRNCEFSRVLKIYNI